MYNHAIKDYVCPICLGNESIENDKTLLKKNDLVYRDDLVSVYINSFWVPTCEGHIIVVPNKHFENIYDLPDIYGQRIFEVSKKMSVLLKKAYKCNGVTIRQNNEPASSQHAFHYHLHVYPRYDNDNFDANITKEKFLSDPKNRIKYVRRLKKYLPEII